MESLDVVARMLREHLGRVGVVPDHRLHRQFSRTAGAAGSVDTDEPARRISLRGTLHDDVIRTQRPSVEDKGEGAHPVQVCFGVLGQPLEVACVATGVHALSRMGALDFPAAGQDDEALDGRSPRTRSPISANDLFVPTRSGQDPNLTSAVFIQVRSGHWYEMAWLGVEGSTRAR
ncbi:hypothetical protein ACFV2U_53140 [Streptomyces sp. NPDC059697]|uniref:hypothetical protein n=1 Tax=Streptomyces sp. NPDC059697 TaxID=3346912 RepID=UPI0036ADC1A9